MQSEGKKTNLWDSKKQIRVLCRVARLKIWNCRLCLSKWTGECIKSLSTNEKDEKSVENTGKGKTLQAADEKLNKFSCLRRIVTTERSKDRDLEKTSASRDKTCSFCFMAPTQHYHNLVIGFSNGLLIFTRHAEWVVRGLATACKLMEDR